MLLLTYGRLHPFSQVLNCCDSLLLNRLGGKGDFRQFSQTWNWHKDLPGLRKKATLAIETRLDSRNCPPWACAAGRCSPEPREDVGCAAAHPLARGSATSWSKHEMTEATARRASAANTSSDDASRAGLVVPSVRGASCNYLLAGVACVYSRPIQATSASRSCSNQWQSVAAAPCRVAKMSC